MDIFLFNLTWGVYASHYMVTNILSAITLFLALDSKVRISAGFVQCEPWYPTLQSRRIDFF